MLLTIISPIYNEEKCIDIFLNRVETSMRELPELAWQVVFVNDGSKDGSLAILRERCASNARLNVISLSRNFGYQAALLAGLTTFESDLYAIIDVDCEDPPELLKEFYAKIKTGFQHVYGIRSNRPDHPLIYLFRRLFYKINNLIADSQAIMWMSEFGMFSKSVRNAILHPRTTYPFLRTELAYVGFKKAGIDYKRQPRVAGKTHYNIFRMICFAIAGIMAGTTFPLRAILYLSFMLIIPFAGSWIFIHDLKTLADLAIVGIFVYLLLTIPFLGLYLARAYKDIVGRQNFIIDDDHSILPSTKR
ncbi:MAG: glycosyltransferase family 2 protein [Candidatus Omnitrophica bacterium]|nr:glycosyltransferase family 2 protein [Candidatus Omnitrophota bacterium]